MTEKTIVCIHGMYMSALCWKDWTAYYQAKGYTCIAPSWPGREEPVERLREKHPDPALGQLTLSDVIQHYTAIIEALDQPPVIIGHSMGGLVVQLLLQRGLATAGVAINSAPPMGVFTTRWSFFKSNWPHISPFAPQNRPVAMSFKHFQYAFVNGLPLAEQRAAYERYVVPESRRVPFESLTTAVDFGKIRPPLLMIAGSSDHIIPASLNRRNHARYRRSAATTNFKEFSGRTHFIIGQQNWEEVADYILEWLNEQAS